MYTWSAKRKRRLTYVCMYEPLWTVGTKLPNLISKMSFKITFLEFGSPLRSSSVTERHRVVTDRAEGRWAKQAEAEA